MYLWHYFSTSLVARYQFFEQKTKIAKKNGRNKRWKNHFEREKENWTLKTFFELQESPSLSFLFIILSRSFVFVKVWSVKKYSSNNRLLKKKLPRYIVAKEAKKRKKERKGERREKIVLKREKVWKESLERQIPWRLKKLRSFKG